MTATRTITRAAVYAALYAALTLAPGLNALAYGQIQFRLSEALLVFACIDPAAVVGLTLGTALGNAGSSLGIIDVVFGSLLTFAAALIMHRLGPRLVALLVPVIVNGLGVALMLNVLMKLPYWLSAGWVAAGEAAVMASAGVALLFMVKRRPEAFAFARENR